jgi:glycosyltransferase involved in cell wall biosynthesis
MRILLSVDPEIPVPPVLYGGIERIVDGIATELQARGHQIALLAHRDSTCAVNARFAWPAVKAGGMRNAARNTVALLGAVSRFAPDLVHSFSRLAYLLPLLCLRVPAIMSYQRHTGGRKLGFAGALGGSRFSFTGCSEYIAGMGRAAGGRWRAIPNFVDTDYFRYAESVAPDAPLVFLSRVERIKGTHLAIAIAREAGRRLLIAGNRPDTAQEREYWTTEIEPHLRTGHVEYVGPVDDAQKNQLLGGAAAMLVPVQWGEPFGIVFAEALACGTPVISCPQGALPEIVRHGEHGFLVNSVDEGIAAAARIASISRAACRRRAEEFFSRRAVVGRYEELYRSLAARRTA